MIRRFWLQVVDRVRRRWGYGTLAGVILVTMKTMWVWLAIPTRFNAVPDARPLVEIWWYFPSYAASGFLLVLLMPKFFDRELGL